VGAVLPKTLGSRPCPELSGLGRVWPVGMSHRAPATPVACRAQCALTRLPGARCFPDILVWLASGLDARCVKKQCGLAWLGCVSEDA
jgi:hypothetical protein